MIAKSLKSYQRVANECIEAFNKIDMRREEGYCVRSGLFSANLTNFLPDVPEQEHESLYSDLLRNLSLEKFDRRLMHLSDVSAIEGDVSLINNPGKPFVFCTFHIGSYRLIANALIRKGYNFSTLVRQEVFELQRSEFKSYCEQMHDTFQSKSEVNILNADDPRVLLKMTRELKAGRSILVYIDGDTGTSGDDHKTTVDFLNQQVKVRKGIPYASYLAGVPILPIVQYRKDNLQNVLRIGKPIAVKHNEGREEFSQRSLTAIYKYFGQYIELYPDQWEGWTYIHNAMVIKPEVMNVNSTYDLKKKRTFRFNQTRYRIFELESNFILFDRCAYETYEITADMKQYLSAPVVRNPIKTLGENIFGELLTRAILV